MARRILLLSFSLLTSVLLFASPASAHNSLVSSDPADGAVLAAAPTQLTLVFGQSVPLDTLTIEIIDATGVRSDLVGSVHGPNGNTEVITPLTALPAGAVNLRWRLVSSDGHAVTGRISFTIAAPPTTAPATVAPTAAAPTTLPANPESATTIDPVAAPTTVPVTLVPTATAGDSGVDFEATWSTPSGVRWLLRLSSYIAIMTIGGVLATTAFVWRGTWDSPNIRRAVSWALATTAGTAVAQLLVVAGDIEGTAPWGASGGLSAALGTNAGAAFGIRVLLVAALAWAMFTASTQSEESQWTLAAALLLGLLATFAFAGHSSSLRWALIGVPLDIAHHAAAATWIGGLAIIGLIAVRERDTAELLDSVDRFARVASISVVVIVVTGVLQSIRLVGSLGQLFDTNHGKLLLLKVAVLVAMLKVADVNRHRVNRRLRTTETASPRVVANLRRAMGTELVVGMFIVAVTAALVASPPAIADDASGATNTSIASPPSTSIATTTTVGTVATACVLSGSPLQLGATGPDVVCLQQALTTAGLYAGEINGSFDATTDTAVRALQTQQGLLVDGIVGRVTATALGIWPTG